VSDIDEPLPGGDKAEAPNKVRRWSWLRPRIKLALFTAGTVVIGVFFVSSFAGGDWVLATLCGLLLASDCRVIVRWGRVR
jgi:hypothetical protein